MAHAIKTARSVLGYSVEGVSEQLNIPTAIIREAEGGELEINDELRAVFEKFYGIDLSTLVRKSSNYAPRTPVSYDPTKGIVRVGKLAIRFRLGVDDNDRLLRGFSSAVRRQRQLPPSVPLQLRSADMPVLATLLDLDDPELDERAQFWFGQTPQTAQSFRTMLRLCRTPERAAADDQIATEKEAKNKAA